jgi:hypothetical protein
VWPLVEASNNEITCYVGAEVRLAPGQTWVELVPLNQGEAS